MKKLNLLSKFTAAGVAVVSTIAVTSFAPAQAVMITGELQWDDATSNFFEDVNPGAGDSFDVTFSPGGLAAVFSAVGDFVPFFPATPPAPEAFYPLTPVTATFDWVSGVGTEFVYNLRNDLVFDFANGVSVTFLSAPFLGSFDGDNGVAFEETAFSQAIVSIPGIDRFVLGEELSFADIAGGNAGEYGAIVQTAVPEPLTILGTGMALGLGTLFKKKRGSSPA
jgi:hypothetical protein